MENNFHSPFILDAFQHTLKSNERIHLPSGIQGKKIINFAVVARLTPFSYLETVVLLRQILIDCLPLLSCLPQTGVLTEQEIHTESCHVSVGKYRAILVRTCQQVS